MKVLGWTGKAEIRTRKTIPSSRRSIHGFKVRTFICSGLSTKRTLISASAAPHRRYTTGSGLQITSFLSNTL